MKEEVIGDCRLVLGDCLEVIETLGPIDHVITDPPYESLVHESAARLATGGQLRDKRNPFKAFDFQSIDKIRDPFVKAIEGRFNGWFIAFCTIEGVAEWVRTINASAIKYKRPCLWIKPDGTPQFNGQCPGLGYECFITAWGGSGASKWNGGGKHGIYYCNKGGSDREGTHPTEKPVKLMSDLIRDFTDTGQTILDPFMGSGTTGVACVNMGRRFIGVEMNEKYFDVARRRIEQAHKQPRLFTEIQQRPKQEKLL